MMRKARLLVAIVLLSIAAGAHADEHSHKYEKGEEVVVWMNTVGPYDNLQETYEFLFLPFCLGSTEIHHHHETLGEALLGVQLVNSGLDIKFRENNNKGKMCTRKLNADDVRLFRHAILNKYWYQMFLDDLPAWDYVGTIEGENMYLFTHKSFRIAYNDDKIIEYNMTSSKKFPLPAKTDTSTELTVPFTYSVEFIPTTQSFATRFNRYLDQDFFEHKIHWFSIFNSFMMVIFLSGLVSIILLRTLRRDYARYDREEGLLDLDRDLGDEYGWKLVHGDVFRAPTRLALLSAFIGTGVQLCVLSICVILYTILGDLYLERATMLTATIFIYALTSMLSGYSSGSFYNKYGGKNWVSTMLMTATLWPGTVSLVAFIVNFAAISITSSRAIPFGTMMAILAIWLFLIFPLTLVGYVIGRNFRKAPDFPCRVNPIPRPIPDKLWYAEPPVLVALAGLFPFGSIFIEIYFVFQSFWSIKIYYVYGFMLLVFVMLIVVTACVSIVSTYLLLNSEDHRWHWTSFMSSGFSAVYVFLYSIYYFVYRTKMYGYFQTSWYFGYTGLVCFGLLILLGTVGHLAAERFIRRIYRNVKID
ncbi:uncharacterized protein SPPG_02737 [Spizellomyces punctatus DAOM BR117]|uniref:Transmembrane 9 superfamily member n=1 Tax=Spizellomyces punctatus (strain DAOM BR117) TaxID=645134 RepID=A0A0L0HMF9_SPIPD|nr:uncharacterized protein SPPG_02737 [Spizellomyces punctatus DAOM BR117]KND02258.1 hypothetical protein SPPG_02737 [Spizellomyces punctatus DAOM BR117]|eukprot:XP_016610297.1 hypothetical protein SPPG_02737 [Spizellomyces punctatus DAOM BR117]